MAKLIQVICLSLVLTSSLSANPAMACPMCKTAIQGSEDPKVKAQPRAYMYSILFMLSMPATLGIIFGISFYRLSKVQTAENEAFLGEFGLGPNAVDPHRGDQHSV
ncbi:hypothetical protein SH668x_002793 [Planctomicrobium sp. SH668]|uniref:hypothetical protein n=1 Tax=Planctomicrobium sp. SH668 TaxID=3448126 RepID=UPI003F5BB471